MYGGDWCWLFLDGSHLSLLAYVGLMIWVFILKRENTHFKELSSIDSLTNIPNRRNAEDILRKEVQRMCREYRDRQDQGSDNQSLVLMMIDIDKFKSINDTYGHPTGDCVLRNVAQVMSGIVQRPVDLVGRWGGEEFVVILPNTTLAGGEVMAEMIRVAVMNLDHNLPGREMVTVSIGVSSTDSSARDVVATADQAVYRAKETGRNRVVSYPFVE